MPLISMKYSMEHARKGNYALPAFSILNTDVLTGVLRAAEEMAAPIIVQQAQLRFPVAPLETIGAAMLAAARKSVVPVVVHLDHGLDMDTIASALDLGFTSVMIDASRNDINENIRKTAAVAEYAHTRNASVEAEIGYMGSEGSTETFYSLSTPDDARRMHSEAGADLLAVAVGNKHGHYSGVPCLDMRRLEQIHAAVPIPLVLHGGSGIASEDLKECISLGVRKINIATDIYAPAIHKLREFMHSCDASEAGFIAVQQEVQKSVCRNAAKYIAICMAEQKA